eukprot:SAG22_NODE_1097_length_5575_cov_2.150292_1_plen_361_part_00
MLLLGALLGLAAAGAAATAAESPTDPRPAAAAAAAARLFVMGGSDPRKPPQGRVAVFSAAGGTNGSWAPAKAMGSMRASGRAAALGGYLYHVGGSDLSDYPYLNSTLRYDPKADSWLKMADIPCEPAHPAFCPDSLGDDPAGGGLADHAVVGLGGFLYVVGGTNGTTSLRTTLRYDPKADSWKYMAPMSVGRCYVAAAVLGGKIYAVGGSATPAGPGGGPGGGPGALRTVEVYTPETDRWELLESLTKIGRATHAVAVAGDGRLYAIGGEDGGSRAIEFDTVERYDPEAGIWTFVAPMALPRAQVAAGVLDGVLYAVGGYNDLTDVGWTSMVEKYDAEGDSWSFAASFPLERQYPTAAVL